jgi:hypothetical protein
VDKLEYVTDIIYEFCRDEEIRLTELNEVSVFSSSNLAVALEYLGLLTDPEMKAYAQNRGGTVFTNMIALRVFSVRDLLSLLPEGSDTSFEHTPLSMIEELLDYLEKVSSNTRLSPAGVQLIELLKKQRNKKRLPNLLGSNDHH